LAAGAEAGCANEAAAANESRVAITMDLVMMNFRKFEMERRGGSTP
jgi:hypothetical protein